MRSMRMPRLLPLFVPGVLAMCLLACAAHAASPRAGRAVQSGPVSADRRLDVNQLNMAVSNVGWVGYDPIHGAAGLQYPKGTPNAVLYAGGLWLGIEHPWVTVAEYSSEYSSGDYFATVPIEERRVFKVVRWTGDPLDTARVLRSPADLALDPTADSLVHDSWSAYMAGAAPYGAPARLWRLPDTSTPAPDDSVDVAGPDVMGDQMLWCIYNDADVTEHTNTAGSSPPLEAEIRQTVFAFDDPGALGRIAYVRYQIVNRGGSPWVNAFASFWADPDVGGYTDDLVGSNPARGMAMSYNGTNNDLIYGSHPPAIGADLLQGATAAVSYINGTDPSSATETYRSMQGLLRNGDPMIDPDTQLESQFVFTGDPVTGTGWLDSSPADRRFLVSRAAGTLAPGDSMEFWVAIVVGQGQSRLGSVQALYCADDAAQQLFDQGFTGPAPGGSCAAAVNCPRRPSYWQDQCATGTQYDPGTLGLIANAADSVSANFDWGGSPLGGFCSLMAAPAITARDSAQREYAALLATVNAGVLGLPPSGGATIGLDPFTAVAVPTLAPGTIGDLTATLSDHTGLTGVAPEDTASGAQLFSYASASPGLYEFFDGGAGYAATAYQSSITPVDPTSMFPSVRLRFGGDLKQRAYRLLRMRTLGGALSPLGDYFYAGFIEIPVSAWNLDTGQQLELVFVEKAVCDLDGTLLPPASQPATFDSTWAPSENSDGDREGLIVLNTPYTGVANPAYTQDGLLIDIAAPALYSTRFRLLGPGAAADDGDHFDFNAELFPTPSAEMMLLRLAGMPQGDAAVIQQYSALAEGLAAINRGDGIGAVCNDPTPVQIALAESTIQPDAVSLSWWVSGAGSTSAAVERSVTGGAWVRVATRVPDGEGRVTYVDRDVAPGQHLDYRLRMSATGEVSEVFSVVVPTRTLLTLAGARPHPARGGRLKVAFTLPVKAPAQLELLDVSGRVIAHQEVGALGAGEHLVDLGAGRRVAPGVYFIRLRQSGEDMTRKAVVLE